MGIGSKERSISQTAVPFAAGYSPSFLMEPVVTGDYETRSVRDAADLLAVQRLRYDVFQRELGEGTARPDEIDVDAFDDSFDHLVLIERQEGRAVGTYRLQTLEQAREGLGFYCAQEFAIETLPEAWIPASVELGRACIAKDHRNGMALFALWRGIAAYMTGTDKRYLFGCCSLTGTDPAQGVLADKWLQHHAKVHPEVRIPVRPPHVCDAPEPDTEQVAAFSLPKLFGTYMRYGALSCSAPAIDHEFGTTDFLVVLDLEAVDPRLRALFFAS